MHSAWQQNVVFLGAVCMAGICDALDAAWQKYVMLGCSMAGTLEHKELRHSGVLGYRLPFFFFSSCPGVPVERR